jgi:hypothetical protein
MVERAPTGELTEPGLTAAEAMAMATTPDPRMAPAAMGSI